MSTLLLRLAGPMQAWGTQSRFTERDTGREPSKSGVVGVLCAALGRSRDETVDDLAGLRMGVRVDREGAVLTDYHTAGGTHRRGERYGVVRADGSPGGTVVSRRHYLADADFLVGLEGDDVELLRGLERALARPVWPLFLGRKAFVPGVPLPLPRGGVRDGMGLVEALVDEPWPRLDLAVPPPHRHPTRLRLVLQTDAASGAEVRADQPVGAAFRDRRFAPRHVETRFCDLGAEVPVREE